MEKLKAGFHFIFASYKRTAAVLFVAALTLAIPITISMVGQQQDIRQRAECGPTTPGCTNPYDEGTAMHAWWESTQQQVNNQLDACASTSCAESICQGNQSCLTDYQQNSPAYCQSTSSPGQCAGTRCDTPECIRQACQGNTYCIKVATAIKECTQGEDDCYFRICQGDPVCIRNSHIGDDIQKDLDMAWKNCAPKDIVCAERICNKNKECVDAFKAGSKVLGFPTVAPSNYPKDGGTGGNTSGTFGNNCPIWQQWFGRCPTPTPDRDDDDRISCSTCRQDQPYLCRKTYTWGDSWTSESPFCSSTNQFDQSNSSTTTCTLCPARPTATPTNTPAPTTTSAGTQISLSLNLVGIGTNTSLGMNPNPRRAERKAEVKVFNSQNQEVSATSGNLRFNMQTGSYQGRIAISDNVQSGPYIVKVRVDNTLWKAIPGIQMITKGQLLQTAVIELVSGDLDQSNEINLTDYTMLVDCYQNQSSCQNLSFKNVKELLFVFAKDKRKGD